MAKRKREDAEEEPSVKQRRIQYKLKLAVTKIGHAFKVAKGFERQKLGRRRKNAASQSNETDVVRIDSEIEALKAIDTTASAQQHFYKTLIRSKDVSNHPDIPAKVKQPVKSLADAATLNVIARLCKSNPVRGALSVAIVEIQQALGLETGRPRPLKKRRTRAKDFTAKDHVQLEDVEADSTVNQTSPRRALAQDHAENSDGHSPDDFSVENDRVGPSSEESEGEDLEIAALERKLESEGLQRKSATRQLKYDAERDLSISDSENERQSASPEPTKTTTSKKATAFLPSLTMGGYISGSGSDIEDDIDEAPRKNRRGQRARQQIWEKKYGAKAKHLQGQGQDRNQGWDPKRGAVDGGRRNDRGHQRARRSSPDYAVGGDRFQPKRRAAGDRNQAKHKDDTGPIHPSWEAAKKAKEKKAAPVAFQGKKITFA